MRIDAEAAARATIVRARADAEAEEIKAKAAKEAADLLSTNELSAELAKMDRSGAFLADNSKIILATESQFMSNLLMRPDKL